MPEGGFFRKLRKIVTHSEAQKTAVQVEQGKKGENVLPQSETEEVSAPSTTSDSMGISKKHPLDFCHGAEDFQAVLSELSKDTSVEGCLLANWEGLLIADEFPSRSDTKPIASFSPMMSEFADKWLSNVSEEKAVTISVETAERIIILKPISRITLIVFAKKDDQLQNLSRRISDASDAIMWIQQNRYGEWLT